MSWPPLLNGRSTQSKCAFGASEVEYLHHLVVKDGVRVDLKKIEAMQDWLHPKTLKILRGFLGLTGYYRKFVKNYGKIATPLIALLKKNSFTWTPATAQDFQTLKTTMCTTRVLALPTSQRHCVEMRRLRERNWCCPYARGSAFGLYQQATIWKKYGQIYLWKGNVGYSACLWFVEPLSIGAMLRN